MIHFLIMKITTPQELESLAETFSLVTIHGLEFVAVPDKDGITIVIHCGVDDQFTIVDSWESAAAWANKILSAPDCPVCGDPASDQCLACDERFCDRCLLHGENGGSCAPCGSEPMSVRLLAMAMNLTGPGPRVGTMKQATDSATALSIVGLLPPQCAGVSHFVTGTPSEPVCSCGALIEDPTNPKAER